MTKAESNDRPCCCVANKSFVCDVHVKSKVDDQARGKLMTIQEKGCALWMMMVSEKSLDMSKFLSAALYLL